MDPGAAEKFLPTISCAHEQRCPGCPSIAQPYAEQLRTKREQVCAALQPYPELRALQVADTHAATRLVGYRTRAKLVARGAEIGLFARGSHDVVDIPDCQVLDPRLLELVALLRGWLGAEQTLDGIDAVRVDERLLVTLIAPEATDEVVLRQLAARLQAAIPALAGVAFTRRQAGAVQLLSGGHVQLSGLGELRSQTAGGPYHYVALGAFQQAHAETSAAIYQRLAARLFETLRTARPRVLELYAGSGALSLALAARGADMLAVESYGPACERLTRAAREQRLSVQVREGDAARELRALWERNERFDAVLVNPPRRGLDPEVREIIAQLAPRAVGYVSCKPGTLARDLAHFARLGLHCSEAAPFDMMPLTEQVETVCWLVPAAPVAPVLLHESERLLAFDKAAHESLDGLTRRVQASEPLRRVHALTNLASGSSGIVLYARSRAEAGLLHELNGVFTALVRGVVRERGKLRAGGRNARYERLQVISGHSLVRVHADSDAQVLRAFRAIGHPVLGDRSADRASAKHFHMRHGLDRLFLHQSALTFALGETRVERTSPLAADLSAVLVSLDSAFAQAVEEHA